MIIVDDIEKRLIKEKERNIEVRFSITDTLYAGGRVLIDKYQIDCLNQGELRYLKRIIESINENDFVY